MLSEVIGGVGIGFVWGWVCGLLYIPARRTARSVTILVGVFTIAVTLFYALIGAFAALSFLCSAVGGWIGHTLWHQELKQRRITSAPEELKET